ncbi:pyridoxamine 5'-phosphate oxidase family protein [Alistipes sp.]|uniref:pyridoxamine 5'-phosphate oxidase family protein n=1 Tax=Alistipes sp. TaxID=1872444 RepID=UPI003AF1A0D3
MNNDLKLLEELVQSRDTAFIASVDTDGFPRMKAMLAPRVREGLRVFYFTTNTSSMRVRHYRLDPRASVYFCDEQQFRGLLLTGTMEVLEDAASRRLVWCEGDEEYYPAGVDDPDYCVLRFTAREGRYYENYHSENIEIA